MLPCKRSTVLLDMSVVHLPTSDVMAHTFSALHYSTISFHEGREIAQALVRLLPGLQLTEVPGADGSAIPDDDREFTPYAEAVPASEESDLISLTIWPASVSVSLRALPQAGCANAIGSLGEVLICLRSLGYIHVTPENLVAEYEQHVALVRRVERVISGRPA